MDFNASFNSGIFPDMMKIANVRPLFKKGTDRMPEIKQYPLYRVFQNTKKFYA